MKDQILKLTQIADELQKQVHQISAHLQATKQAEPSFDATAIEINYDGIEEVRAATIENLTQLHDLLLTPREVLQLHMDTDYISRNALDRFNVYDVIPVGETRRYEEIAAAIGLPTKTVRRLLRHAISQRIFCEPIEGVVAHTTLSRLLTENKAVRDYYGVRCQLVWPITPYVVDAIQKLSKSESTDTSPHFYVRGKGYYETLAQDEVLHARYDSAMAAYTNERLTSIDHVTKYFDWSGLGKALVVDLGGGIGTLSKYLSKLFPDLRFIVQDQQDVIASAVVENTDIAPQIEFMAHDFFKEQPIKNVDVFFVRRVFMEWSDDKIVDILRNLQPAMKSGCIILVNDVYNPAPQGNYVWQDRKLRSSDMLSLCLSGNGAREREEWENIFTSAGNEFKIRKITPVPNTSNMLLEAVYEP